MCLQIHWPDRYVPLFGGGAYDPEKERDEIPFEEQLVGLDNVIRAGKVLGSCELKRRACGKVVVPCEGNVHASGG